MTQEAPQQQFRVWYIPQVPMKAFEVDVPDVKTGRLLLDAIERFSLFEYENQVKPDYADAGGVAYLDEDGDWIDLEDEEDEDHG